MDFLNEITGLKVSWFATQKIRSDIENMCVILLILYIALLSSILTFLCGGSSHYKFEQHLRAKFMAVIVDQVLLRTYSLC